MFRGRFSVSSKVLIIKFYGARGAAGGAHYECKHQVFKRPRECN